FFNTSVDDLLGYEPQMSKQDVKQLYRKLVKEFAAKPFEDVYGQCRTYEKKYFSCWNLQFHIALLLVNHANLAGSPEKTRTIILESEKIFARVATECDDVRLARQAISLRAFCFLATNQPALAIDLLGDLVELPMSIEVLLSKAYQMKGEHQKAKSLLQGYLYHHIMGIMTACPDFMMMYMDDPAKVKDGFQRFMDMGDIFEVGSMQPHTYLPIFLTAAQVYITQGDNDGALEMLDRYVEKLKSPGLFPLKLKGNEFLDSLDGFFESLDLGTEAPRSKEVIKQSMVEAITHNPAFEAIRSEDKYIKIVKKLERLMKEELK
ncbi:MAG: transcriptional regulator, partial [Eubacteriales bacterium]|nr:transcriptional regulator [Eubacteriales bacterium]